MTARKISVLGVDPSFSNFGIARMSLDLDTLALDLIDLKLIETEKSSGKQVRVNSDDFRRAQILHAGFRDQVDGVVVVFSEIPSGTQSATAAKGLGIALGVLASCPVPITQVQPLETKMASVGRKTATKREIIEWASSLYPHPSWLRERGKVEGRLVDANEHLADAVAVVHAGIKTDEFKRSLAIWNSSVR